MFFRISGNNFLRAVRGAIVYDNVLYRKIRALGEHAFHGGTDHFFLIARQRQHGHFGRRRRPCLAVMPGESSAQALARFRKKWRVDTQATKHILCGIRVQRLAERA